MEEHECKSCGDPIYPDHPMRKDWPASAMYDRRRYCRACYFELVTGEIPNVTRTEPTGKAGLTPRQAGKLGMTSS